MKTIWWKVRYTLCFCQHVGWTAVALGWKTATIAVEEQWMDGWCDPVDACLEELSYWND